MKIWTKTYRNKNNELVAGGLAEEVFEIDELGNIVDEYRIMEEYLQENGLVDDYTKFKRKISKEK